MQVSSVLHLALGASPGEFRFHFPLPAGQKVQSVDVCCHVVHLLSHHIGSQRVT